MNVQTAAKASGTSATLEKDALSLMDDPWAFFGMSNTQVHSMPREDAEALQLAAMNILLEKRRTEIPVLAKFADTQDIRRLNSIDDMAPLLFEHKVYKSYPVSLLAKQRYDQLTQWLDRLTPYDLSGIDVSKCKSIEDWMVKLQTETPLDVACSSGTTGTMSFFPRSRSDYMVSLRGCRIQLVQTFGREPTQSDLHEKLHAIIPLYRDGHSAAARVAHYAKEVFCLGDESYLHAVFNYKLSPDLMWLSARLRAAAAKGDVTRVDVPEVLLARRAELEEMKKQEAPEQIDAYINKLIKDLKGQRVFIMGAPTMLFGIAERGLKDGVRGAFGPGSVLMTGGGTKGLVLPDNWAQMCLDFFGADRMRAGYGMTEVNVTGTTCEHDHHHVPPSTTLFILDLDSGKPKPRSGVQTGRAAFFDMTHQGSWGGIITGDQITVDWDTPCSCGRATIPIKPNVARVSELQGGNDKINCAAAPAAQAEAMEYLTSFNM